MAFLNNTMGIIGSFGNLSAYRMKGSDKIIVRTKGGASKKKIKKSPVFARTRENNSEFSGCAKMVKSIRSAIQPIGHLADFNFTPSLIALCKKIQLQDPSKDHPRGERAIYLSQFKYLLDGFSLNKQNSFNTVIRHTLHPQLNRNNGSFTLLMPALIPHFNLCFFWPQPMYRLVFSIGLAGDLEFGTMGFANNLNLSMHTNYTYTPWHLVSQAQNAQEINLQLKAFTALNIQESLIITAGIEMGTPISLTEIRHTQYCGTAKIIGVG